MIRSMTGYARHETTALDHVLTWEARSVNHRYLEVSFRTPEPLRSREPHWRARAAERLARGKVELNLRIGTNPAAPPPLAVNEALVGRLLAAARRVAVLAGYTDPGLRPGELLRWPGVIEEPAAEDAALAVHAEAALDAVLEALVTSRASEGARLSALLEERCERILGHVAAVRSRLPELRDGILGRWRERIGRLGVEVDEQRLEQELALLISRMDVDEELDRLQGHVTEIRSTLGAGEPVGRRLDFLIQELNREANTLASKSADTAVTREAVELKVLIEQMREQVQNVE